MRLHRVIFTIVVSCVLAACGSASDEMRTANEHAGARWTEVAPGVQQLRSAEGVEYQRASGPEGRAWFAQHVDENLRAEKEARSERSEPPCQKKISYLENLQSTLASGGEVSAMESCKALFGGSCSCSGCCKAGWWNCECVSCDDQVQPE